METLLEQGPCKYHGLSISQAIGNGMMLILKRVAAAISGIEGITFLSSHA